MNNEPKFCHLNSGAPRCSAAHNGFPAPRSRDLFLCSERYERTPSSVREVTFDEECFLPHNVYISDHPDKSFKKV